MSLLQHQLPYHHDSSLLFERIEKDDWAIFLDSGQAVNVATGNAGSQYGRYDILVAEPFITVVTEGQKTTVMQDGVKTVSEEDPFFIIKELLLQYPAPKTSLPFAGGLLGYFAYDLARRIEKLPTTAAVATETPQMMLGLYDWAVIVDHREKRSMLVSHGLTAATKANWPVLCKKFECKKFDDFNAVKLNVANPHEKAESPFEVTSDIHFNLTEPQYQRAFAKIKAYISAGDCYQVNLAQRFAADVQGDSWQAYKKLREISPAPFMTYMNLPLNAAENFQILSNSPERFLQTDGDHVETRPIKGTRPRSADPIQDLAYSNELLTSLKDKAENVMIVDLLRNDIGKNCTIGSVKAEKLFQLQSFANVHHLVSIVTGKLKQTATAVDLLKGCFPGGSITGAPKLRAMQIIEELEPQQRGLYCGAIGYIGFDGKMDTNIAIRTAVICKNQLSFYAGGGIVADSDASKEYAETLDKASNLVMIIKFFMRL